MRDKSYIFLLLCCSLSLGACSSDSASADISPQELFVYGTTESYALSRDDSYTSLPSSYNMWVGAVYHNASSASHEYFFQPSSGSIDLGFAYDSASGSWKVPGLTYTYPLDGTLDFLGYATQSSAHKPTATFSPASLSSSSPTFSSLSLDFGTSLDGSDDVLFSDLLTVGCKSIGAAAKPQLNFRHALSKIVFYLRTSDANTASFLRIYGLMLKSVNCSGVLSVSPGIPSGAVWSSVTGAADVAVPGEDSFKTPQLVSSDSDMGSCFGTQLYLPSQLGASSFNLVITYHVTTPSSNFESRPTLPLTISLPSGNWLPGLQYTYILTFSSLKEISVECTEVGVIIDSQPVDLNFNEIY